MSDRPEPASSSALARFGVLAGPRAGEELAIHAPTVTIGQGPQNDVVLTDDSVSRTHARLEYRLGSWLLTDLESTNGTAIDGTKLAPGVPTPLADGVEVRFGGVRLEFREAPGVDPEAARASFREPTAPAEQRARHFRLPLWLFLVILIVVAVAVFLLAGGLSATELSGSVHQMLSGPWERPPVQPATPR
ncbi:MAG TPA: FHA domain-containing protein [Longimicrobiaceae bacterium]